MKVLKNYLWNVVYQIFVIIIPIITIPYLSRVLGPTGIGINSFTNSIAQYFILLGSIGVNIYGNRQIAYVKEDSKLISQTFWGIYFMRAITVLISVLAYAVFIFIYGKYTIFFWAQLLQIIATFLDVAWFFMGMENFKVTVLRNILVKALTLISIFVFVRTKQDTLLYILIIGVSSLVGNLTMVPYLKKYISKPKFHNLNMWNHFVPSVTLFVPQVAIQVYVVFNKTVLGQMVSVQASGFYDNSDKIVRVLLAITTALGSVMLPHIAAEFAKKNYEKIKSLFYASFDFICFITIPMAFGLASVANDFSILFFGDAFKSVGSLMFMEAFASIFMSWAYAIGTQYMLPTNQNRSYTLSVTIGAIVNIVSNFPLIYFLGVKGAMVATIVSEMSVTFTMIYSIRKQINPIKMFTNLPSYLFSAILMFISVMWLNGKLAMNWMNLGIEVIVGVFVYIAILLILKPTIIEKIRVMISS